MKAYIFPGQGSQVVGMGKDLQNCWQDANEFLAMANDILGFDIAELMLTGSAEQLKQTRVTQPAVFIYSTLMTRINRNFKPDIVAGHSLGEFSALVANRTLSFGDGLRLVAKRAELMQKQCDENPSAMAAVLGLEGQVIDSICHSIEKQDGEIVVVANYNCPGQIVISGTNRGVDIAKDLLKEAGARTIVKLKVNGAFHSPLMEPAQEALAEYIENTRFRKPLCPIYQNLTARPSADVVEIKENLKNHLTAPVRWIEIVENMIMDGTRQFIEVGPKSILQNMIKRIDHKVQLYNFAE